VEQGWVKRFAAADWTVDFPRGAMASTVVNAEERGMTIEAHFLRKGDLVGLIYESEDRHSHPARSRETGRDYSRCTLEFRWKSTGLIPLDQANAPALTIEGRDEGGAQTTWFVRLWDHASGSPTNAAVSLDFDELEGWTSAGLVPVWPKDVERIFFSLVPPGYEGGSGEAFAAAMHARLEISALDCTRSGSVIAAGDAWAPEHGFNACTAYDDMYHLAPQRVVRAVEASGFRGTISHYVGMSHYPAIGPGGLVDATQGMCVAAREWHRAFARAAKDHGFEVIWSLSYELLDSLCPGAWKQRAHDGSPAQTAYNPPSTLLSPANSDAMAYLCSIAAELVGISVEAGLQPQLQIGEPWWWVRADGAICCYDDAARTALGGTPVVIEDVRAQLDEAQKSLLDAAGALLSASTGQLFAAARAAAPQTTRLLLAYLPAILDRAAPELQRANLPVGWARPHCDVMQLEDYEWVTGGRSTLRASAFERVEQRLGYAPRDQHYFSGFVAVTEDREQWSTIIAAAREADARGVAKTFIWAIPQWLRDGVTLLGEEIEVQPFDDVDFPIAIGAEASVSPGFSTNVVTSASGHEYRNSNWSQARLRFDAGPGVRGERELGELIAFYRARRGPAVAFRFRDPFDHSSNGMTENPGTADQLLGEGDGERRTFDLIKRYGGGEERRINMPVAGSVRVSVDGVERSTGWTLDPLGVVAFDEAPASGAVVSAGFLFDVPVRFSEDRLEINRETFLAGQAPSVPLVEVRIS
jgi:uncharacterized protein (TIGR02217 family)